MRLYQGSAMRSSIVIAAIPTDFPGAIISAPSRSDAHNQASESKKVEFCDGFRKYCKCPPPYQGSPCSSSPWPLEEVDAWSVCAGDGHQVHFLIHCAFSASPHRLAGVEH